MKTIEISDELYEKLEHISKTMNNQNHLCTAMPYIWTIKERKQLWADEDSHDWWLLIDEWAWEPSWLWDDSKKKDFYSYIRDMELSDEWKKYRKEHEWEISAYWVEGTIAEFLCEEHDHRKWYYQWEDTFKNFFLTQEACEAHIKSNHYHYTEPQPYLFHAWRNPEMEAVQRFLCELTGGKLHT